MTIFYTKDLQWVRETQDGFVVGLTARAVKEMGKLTLVELPPLGDRIQIGDEAVLIESTKAATDLVAPLSGQVIECNDGVTRMPTLASEEPEGAGWLYKLRAEDRSELALLSRQTPDDEQE
ncbi:glycine cleavage system protein H [Sulfitobacter sp. HNIBRBA3233]|uniref:glycine cleavage system protein H n=1 Tax=Sulfitobacter marinivivus TaxID=3158558 RepID=UPI0032E04BAE